jgi:hypothetical protein
MPRTKVATSFRLDTGLVAQMQEVRDVDGIPLTVQVEKALKVWLELKAGTITVRKVKATTRRTR